MLKKFKDLSEREILALAIASEEEDGRIYGEFADALRESYPATAEMFEGMREEEAGHRDRLLAMFRARFGERIKYSSKANSRGCKSIFSAPRRTSIQGMSVGRPAPVRGPCAAHPLLSAGP